tara:strand:- start:43 stop:1602 length:1560 start_codon:yes stop_codon:yes gene_type:complete
MNSIRVKRLGLSILSGLLFAFSWVGIGFFPLIFIAFIPILLLEKDLSEDKSSLYKLFVYSFITFFLFNIITTFWIWHASVVGAFVAFFVNTILMSSVLVCFSFAKRIIGDRKSYFTLLSFWITMEYLHLNWELAWPWLNLGNVFASNPFMVQWYEYTGVLGGTLWILLINILIFRYIQVKKHKNWVVLLVFVLPLIISFFLSKKEYIIDKELEVVIVQPNIDPYFEKFSIDPDKQLDDLILLSKEKLTQNTLFLIAPETAIQESIWESNIQSSSTYKKIRLLQSEFPNLNIIMGANTFRYLGENRQKNSRKLNNSDDWYNCYNTSILFGNNKNFDFYHKVKLVPGVEQIPYSNIFNLIADFTINLGGVSGSLSIDNTIEYYKSNDIKIVPLICYESVFGEILNNINYNLLVIITNDGWWKDTPGYKQHLQYSRLRSIEQRKFIVRSANTGISAIINIFGEIIEQSNWDQKHVIRQNVNTNNITTFYNIHGDYIGRILSFLSVLIFLSILVKFLLKKTSL